MGGNVKRCLFVDDSGVVRKVAKRILASPEMAVIEAAGSAEALEMCVADMPDIIVLDGTLPDMQPAEFIRRVRAIPSPVVPKILVSLVEVDIGAIMRTRRAGAQGYLLKPFNRPLLLERFRALQAAA
jgi:two-component system chemotaxis response regulator CheY